jgi:hypothetical protein
MKFSYDSAITGASPFWHIPLEVRLMIYEYVILSGKDGLVFKGGRHRRLPYQIGKPIPYNIRGKCRSGVFFQDQRTLWHSTPALAIAFTCRQMYLEAAPIWYSNMGFSFMSLDSMKSFVQSIGARS